MITAVSKRVPAEARPLLISFLKSADAKLPGVIEGLYLVGSVALGEFRPRKSDIDFVAVSRKRLGAEQVATLQTIHREIQREWRRPYFDGIYVSWDELAGDPAAGGPYPVAHEGTLRDDGTGEPVTWHTVAEHGLVVRGPQVGAIKVWTDAAALAAWTDDNLETYWRPLIANYGSFGPATLVALTPWACEWSVLGLARLHYTQATGKITSKTGAGEWARKTYPERWQRVIDEALRIRRGGGGRGRYLSPFRRRRDMLDFCTLAIEESHRLYQSRPA